MKSQPDGDEFLNFLRTEFEYNAGDCYQTKEDCDYSFQMFK